MEDIRTDASQVDFQIIDEEIRYGLYIVMYCVIWGKLYKTITELEAAPYACYLHYKLDRGNKFRYTTI